LEANIFLNATTLQEGSVYCFEANTAADFLSGRLQMATRRKGQPVSFEQGWTGIEGGFTGEKNHDHHARGNHRLGLGQ